MALLTVAPYDPWKQTAWVGDLIKLSAQMREEKAKRQQQASQQALADQRRAFEFDRRLEFERARTAADDLRADSRLDMERQIFADNRAPFALPPSLGPSSPGGGLPSSDGPASSLPTLETNDTPTGNEPTGVTESTDGLNTDPDAAASVPSLTEAEDPADTAARAEFEKTLLPPRPGDPPGSKRTKAGILVEAPDPSVPPLPGAVPSGGIVKTPANSLPPVNGATGLSGEPTLFPTAAVPGNKGKPASHVADLARELAASGLWNRPGGAKQANQIITQAAAAEASRRPGTSAASKPTVRNFADGTTRQHDPETNTWVTLASKPKAESEDLADVVGDAKYNKDHGTYVRQDGSEFFPARSASGKWMVKPFTPSQKPAKLLWGDDGNVYPVDAQGEFLKPKPDGVQVRDHANLQTVDVAGVGRMIVNPDQSTRLLIPAGVPLTAKQRDKYTEDSQALRAADAELHAQTKLLKENPSKVGVSWFGGGTKAAVDDAQKKLDASRAAVEQWQKDFPQLAAKNMPSTSETSGAIPKVTGADDPAYKALPSGALYFGPDGAKARKK
jgi:hypothetical protein